MVKAKKKLLAEKKGEACESRGELHHRLKKLLEEPLRKVWNRQARKDSAAEVIKESMKDPCVSFIELCSFVVSLHVKKGSHAFVSLKVPANFRDLTRRRLRLHPRDFHPQAPVPNP